MDTEMAGHGGSRAVRRARSLGVAALGLLLAFGCFTQKPPGENTPSSAPEAPPPSPPAPPAPLREEREAPAPAAPAEMEGPATRAVRPPASAAPVAPAKPAPERKPAAKARSVPSPDERASEGSARDVRGGVTGGAGEPPSTELRQRLDRAYRAGTPDCPSARDRKKAVCDLAAQICQLIDRDPNVASVAEYCADAKERCAEAQRRTEQRCPD